MRKFAPLQHRGLVSKLKCLASTAELPGFLHVETFEVCTLYLVSKPTGNGCSTTKYVKVVSTNFGLAFVPCLIRLFLVIHFKKTQISKM